jgi:hypothetical protein
VASWQFTAGPDSKANINTALGALTIAKLICFDPVPLSAGDATLASHLSAAITAAQGALAALAGPATKATVSIVGYRDTALVAPSGMVASKIKITALEVF